MMNAALLALVLALPAPPPGQALPPPPSSGGAMFLEQDDPISAAGVFEDLWTTTHQPDALVWAGLSRARAGDAAHAVAYLAHALELALPPSLADSARAALADARQQTRLLTIELHLHGPGPVSLAFTRREHSSPTLNLPIAPEAGVQLVPMILDPGPWIVELHRGPQTLSRTIVVDAQHRRLTLREPVPPAPPSPRLRQFRLAGLITGGNMMLLGVAFFGFSEPFARAPDTFPGRLNLDDLAVAYEWRAAGTGMLGAGLGITTGTLAALAPRPQIRRILWSFDLAVGGALVGASFLGGLGGAAFNRSLQAAHETRSLPPVINLHAAGAAMLGLGLGLATSATISLLLDRADQRRSNRLRAHIAPTGVTLVGHF